MLQNENLRKEIIEKIKNVNSKEEYVKLIASIMKE